METNGEKVADLFLILHLELLFVKISLREFRLIVDTEHICVCMYSTFILWIYTDFTTLLTVCTEYDGEYNPTFIHFLFVQSQ